MPDSVFVEDPIVVMRSIALLTHPGAPSRRGEGASMESALAGFAVERMSAPAMLDGGDVLALGNRLFVGVTERTNREGIERLRSVASREGLETVAVEVQAGLHLKSAVTRLGDAVIGLFDRIDPAPFASRGNNADSAGSASAITILVAAVQSRCRGTAANRSRQPRFNRGERLERSADVLDLADAMNGGLLAATWVAQPSSTRIPRRRSSLTVATTIPGRNTI